MYLPEIINDCYIYRVEMPKDVNEMISPCPDYGYTIYIDSRLDNVRAMESYQHAIAHVKSNDFEKDDVQNIEQNAHK